MSDQPRAVEAVIDLRFAVLRHGWIGPWEMVELPNGIRIYERMYWRDGQLGICTKAAVVR